jgi:hypothetical protein
MTATGRRGSRGRYSPRRSCLMRRGEMAAYATTASNSTSPPQDCSKKATASYDRHPGPKRPSERLPTRAGSADALPGALDAPRARCHPRDQTVERQSNDSGRRAAKSAGRGNRCRDGERPSSERPSTEAGVSWQLRDSFAFSRRGRSSSRSLGSERDRSGRLSGPLGSS